MQTTAEFANNSTTNIKLSKRPSFLSLDFEQVHYEKKRSRLKKLFGGVVALKISRKLTCDSWFCNAGGCKTQISIELGCSSGKFAWIVEGEQCCKSQLIKVTN